MSDLLRRYRLAFALFLLLAHGRSLGLEPHKELRHYSFSSWHSDNGLPQNTVNAVLQTRDGYLWIATQAGLARFDGIDFTIFDAQNTPALHSKSIRSLFRSSDGTLFILTADGLVLRDQQRFRAFTTADGLPDNNILEMQQTADGTVYALTAGGLATIREGHITAVPKVHLTSILAADTRLLAFTPDGISQIEGSTVTPLPGTHFQVHSAVRSNDGKIWLATDAGIAFLDHAALKIIPTTPAEITTGTTTLKSDRDGRLWIGTEKGLFLLEHGHFKQLTAGLPSPHINVVYEDRNNILWVGTNRGLARFDGDHFSALTAADGLLSPVISTVLEDQEGDIWFGTEAGGINVLRDQKFTSYTSRLGLSDDRVTVALEDRHHAIWVGTKDGLNRLHDGRFTTFTVADGIASDFILSLAEDAAGDLWIGTPDGLTRKHGAIFSSFTVADGLPDDFIRALATTADGSLWIATRQGFARFRDGRFEQFAADKGLSNDHIGAMAELPDGLLLGTSNGIALFRDGVFHDLPRSTPKSAITALYADPAGRTWIGTADDGLSVLDAGNLIHFKDLDLPETIYGIVPDAAGDLWLASPRGAVKVNSDELLKAARSSAGAVRAAWYGTADGMSSRECNAAMRASDGSLWFATTNGLSKITPSLLPNDSVPPPITIESVTVDDRALAPGVHELAPGSRRIAFHFAGISLAAPHRVTYQYRLDGFDKDWVPARERRDAFYTNLPPRHYIFRVRAANRDGVWSESAASFEFSLRPHFYRTYWFYALCVACLGLLLWLIYRLRMRRIESEFALVLAERTRIARDIHDTLAQDFVGISVQLELISRSLSQSVDTARDHLNQARALVRQSVANARRSVWALRSDATSEKTLPASLAQLARSQHDANTRSDFELRGTYRPLDADLEEQLFRIAQEAFTNALRHAHAKRILISLEYDLQSVTLSVQDDGNGFLYDPSANLNGHFGLVGMRERAAAIRATLDVESSSENGTTVTATTDLNNNASKKAKGGER